MKTIMAIEPAYQPALRAAGLADFDAVMGTHRAARVTAHRQRETGRLEIAVEGQRAVFFLKRVFRVPPKHGFWPLFRLRLGRSQPYHEWHILGELDRAGLPAMRRVAFGERRRFGMPTRAFLLVEAAPMEYTLQNWLLPGFAKPPTWDTRLRGRLIFELGRLIGRLHTRGFTWPDLHAKHIFATPLAQSEPKPVPFPAREFRADSSEPGRPEPGMAASRETLQPEAAPAPLPVDESPSPPRDPSTGSGVSPGEAAVISPGGAAVHSPGRKPWVPDARRPEAPEGRQNRPTSDASAAPSGLTDSLCHATQGSRPGLFTVAPNGASSDSSLPVSRNVRPPAAERSGPGHRAHHETHQLKAAPTWAFRLIDVERMTRMWPSAARSLDGQIGERITRHLTGELLAFRQSLRPLGVTAWELRRFLAGYRVAAREQPSPLETRDLFSALAAAGSQREPAEPDVMPRLPDDYEHPACIPFANFESSDQAPWVRMDVRASRFLLPPKDVTFQELLESVAGRPMDKPGLGQHRRRVRLDFGEKVFYLKRYDRPPLAAQLRRICESKAKRSTAWREFHFIKRLGEIGISAAKPVAFSEKMIGPWEVHSFLITEEIDSVSLEKLAHRAATEPNRAPPWPQRREIIEQLAAIARELHRNDLFHRDFYLCHLFLTPNRDGGVVLRLIDLARMIESPRRSSRWRIKDLTALNYSAPSPLVTKADRLRFLYHYVPGLVPPFAAFPGPDQAARKQRLRYIIHRIEARSRRMARHDASRGRRLRERTKA